MSKNRCLGLLVGLFLAAAAALSGCGGGGGTRGSDPVAANAAPVAVAGAAPSAVTGVLVTLDGRVSSSVTVSVALDAVAQADRALAAAGQLSAVVDLVANTLRLAWNDSFPDGTSYRVESRERPDAAFGPLETLVVSGGAGAAMAWTRALTVSTTYRVQALVDGQALPTLTAPNACSSRFGCGTAFDAYRFTLDASALGSGSHGMVVSATDLAGARQQAPVQVPVANPPFCRTPTPTLRPHR